MQAFQNKATGFAATIHALSLSDYRQFEITLPLPGATRKKDFFASTCWINDINIYKDKAVLSLQDRIVLYKKEGTDHFVYDTMYEHRQAITTYLYKGELYYLVEDHDKGYEWFHRNSKNGKEEVIGTLAYEAPHLVQANPNRYLFHDENNLFFLSTRYPVLRKYTLDGKWIEDIRFDFPDWHPFEDEYVRKSLDVPYGVDRIYATMQEIFKYSYPKIVYPIGGTYLMYYTQYDSLTQSSTLQFAMIDTNGKTVQYQVNDADTGVFDDQHFPFNLLDYVADKANISWNDLLIEISEESEIPYRGKTPKEYQRAQEEYFKQHDPTLKFRIMRYKNSDRIAQPFFYDTDHHLSSLTNLSQGKTVLLINNELECSACKNHLLTQLSTLNPNTVHIGILYPFIPGALLERNLKKEIGQYLTTPFSLYYLATDRFTSYPRILSTDPISYPAILLYESNKAPLVFSAEQIFSSDVHSYDFTDDFQKIWDDFTSK